ncbi:endonuclease [Candidatus Dependentiae bacterium Noda2021]|nr:endonuclease [Candidatus Dependentiae bacterium Noda2021]
MEGPSIHQLASDLQPFVNKKIKKIYGNSRFEKEDLVGQKIKEIFAIGKRLVIQLETTALITHFLMYGSFRINEERPDRVPRLAIYTYKDRLYFYSCSVKRIEDTDFKKSVLFEYDILSDHWDRKKVIKAMKKHPKARIDDMLLNQDIFAGVGNIIKNEALFMSNVSPEKKISALSDKKLALIAQNAQDFSFNFLQWRKLYQLKKNLLIYRKLQCPVCRTKVKRGKTGVRNRWSFWCPKCQK